MIIKDQTTMKKKYYYYVALLTNGNNIIYVNGTYETTKDDFPIQEVEKHVLKNFKMPIRVIISFYKEITKENYKSYNNEQQD